MGERPIQRVRAHVEAIIGGESALTPEELKAASGDLRATLVGLQLLAKRLKENGQASAQREAWFAGVMSAAQVALWECDVTRVRQRLDAAVEVERLDRDARIVRELAESMTIADANEEALAMFGAKSRAALDSCIDEVVRDDAVPLFRALFRALARGERRAKLEGTVYRMSGDVVHVVVAMVSMHPRSNTITLAWSDLTGHDMRVEAEQAAKQQVKELERVNKDVERLFRAVSHDLRAPLRAVNNLAEWALEDLAGGNLDDVGQHLRALTGRVERLERMLTDLLSYARLGRAEQAFESVDVGRLLEDVQGMIDAPTGFALRWASMPTVVTQRTLLVQVFLNLIGNAIKHHDDPSTGVVEISAEDQDNFCVFRVSDNGPGIPLKHRNKIFGLFTTLKRRDEVEGSGMGLAFVQKVIRQCGGQIAVTGPDGRGTTFEFSWPKGPTAKKRKKARPPTLVGIKTGSLDE